LPTNEPKLSAADAEEVKEKYEKIASKLYDIDAMINEETLGWDTGRMAKVDLTIIRLAIYEIKV
jgi:N utilization substance protein B